MYETTSDKGQVNFMFVLVSSTCWTKHVLRKLQSEINNLNPCQA